MPLWELALQAVWAHTLTTLLLKLQTYLRIKSPLHFYGTSGLLPLNKFVLKPITNSYNQDPAPLKAMWLQPVYYLNTLMPLTGPDNPLLCHYFCYYLKWIYDNEMSTTGGTLTCSYGGLGEEISDLQSLRE